MKKRRRAYKQYDPRVWRRKIYIQRVNKLLAEHGDEVMQEFIERAKFVSKAFSNVKRATIHYEPKQKKETKVIRCNNCESDKQCKDCLHLYPCVICNVYKCEKDTCAYEPIVDSKKLTWHEYSYWTNTEREVRLAKIKQLKKEYNACM